MILFLLIAGLTVLLGVPALVDPVRHAAARRAAARTQRDADARRRQQQAEDEEHKVTQLWTGQPVTAGADETLRFKTRVHDGLMRQLREQASDLRQRDEQVQQRERNVRDGEPVTTGYRLRVLVGLALFLVVTMLGIALDYLIFRGLHPTGTLLFPLGLACLAVIGITAGAVVCFDATRHHLVPAAVTPYVRRVIALSGAMLAIGITVYMAVIAPYRSIPTGQTAITLAEQRLASDQSQLIAGQSGSISQLISADKAAVVQARAHLSQAARVDRASAAVLAVLDIFLAEAGFLGAELILLDLAVLHRKLAQRRVEQAAEGRLAAENAYINALHQILTRHGHTNADELIPQILARVGRLMTWARQSSAQDQLEGTGFTRQNGASDHADRPDGAGQASGSRRQGQPAAAPPVFGPVAQPPTEDDDSPPHVIVISPDPETAGPGTEAESSGPDRPLIRHPSLRSVPTGSPAPTNLSQQGDLVGGGAASNAAELPPEEFDMTA